MKDASLELRKTARSALQICSSSTTATAMVINCVSQYVDQDSLETDWTDNANSATIPVWNVLLDSILTVRLAVQAVIFFPATVRTTAPHDLSTVKMSNNSLQKKFSGFIRTTLTTPARPVHPRVKVVVDQAPTAASPVMRAASFLR